MLLHSKRELYCGERIFIALNYLGVFTPENARALAKPRQYTLTQIARRVLSIIVYFVYLVALTKMAFVVCNYHSIFDAAIYILQDFVYITEKYSERGDIFMNIPDVFNAK